MRADHGVGVKRMALLDGFDPLDRPLDELAVDRFLDQRPRRAGADFALIEREHGEAFQRLVEEVVFLRADIGEEHIRRFAAQFQRHRDQVLRGVLHDQPAGGGFTGEGDLGDAAVGSQRLAGFHPEAVDHVDHAGRQQVLDQLQQHQDGDGGLFGRLQHHAVTGGQRRGQFPDRHQNREIPGDDLADHPQRFVEMVGDGVVVDLRQRAFLGADAAGEVAEVVDGQRHVRRHGLAHRLAVVPGFGHRQHFQILFHPVGDAVETVGPLRRRGAAPGIGRSVRRV